MNRRWINTKVEFIWDGSQYVEQSAEGYWYDGEMALCYTVTNNPWTSQYEVGIGTNNPGVYKLMVEHSSGGTEYPVARFHGTHAGGGTRVVLTHSGNSNTNSYGFVCGGTDTGTDEKFGIVRFNGTNGTYEANPYMTFDSSGNVGIGTSSPETNP